MRMFTASMLVGLALAGVLAVAGGLPFDTPMPTQQFGVVEPSCGLTRGSTALVRGDLGRAWAYNPASFAVIGAGVFGAVRFAVGSLTGRWWTIRVRWAPLGLVGVAVAVALLWAHQQSNAEFIINARG